MSTIQNTVDQDKLMSLVFQIVGDWGAAWTVPLTRIGERLGLYKALAERGPAASKEIAEATGTSERYVREWLAQQAASGYIAYDTATHRYFMTPEQIKLLADETSPLYLHGMFQLMEAAFKSAPEIERRFVTGGGFGWHEHDAGLFEGTERFFKPGYVMNLIDVWLPALDGVMQKLQAGATAADVGCGLGATTIIMAKSFPQSQFVGFDYHAASIEMARERAAAQGAPANLKFEVATAKSFPGSGYDLVTNFDCLHDMGDPVGAAEHVYKALDKDGTWMVVEPFSGDRVEDNFTPVGRMFYGASTLLCTPGSLSQEVGAALGAQAGETRIRDVTVQAGFTRFRRATQTPFNIIYEVRP